MRSKITQIEADFEIDTSAINLEVESILIWFRIIDLSNASVSGSSIRTIIGENLVKYYVGRFE